MVFCTFLGCSVHPQFVTLGGLSLLETTDGSYLAFVGGFPSPINCIRSYWLCLNYLFYILPSMLSTQLSLLFSSSLFSTHFLPLKQSTNSTMVGYARHRLYTNLMAPLNIMSLNVQGLNNPKNVLKLFATLHH